MSGKRFQARAKRVQKLGRDGLIEQNLATGEEKRISQRAADISFGPDRSQEQAAGRRTSQPASVSHAATPNKKRYKQPRPIQQTAEEMAWAAPQEPDIPPTVPEPAAASMRMAVDAPMMTAPAVDVPPAPPPAPRRHNRTKSKRQQAAKHTPDAARSPEAQPTPMRADGDVPIQNRPPGSAPAKRPPRPADGCGRLRYKAAERERPISGEKPAGDVPVENQPPRATQARHTPRLTGGHERLQFKDAKDEVKQPAVDGRNVLKKKQARKLSSDISQSPENQLAPMRTDGDVPMQERPAVPTPAKEVPRPVEGGGRLRYKVTERERPPSDEKSVEDISVADRSPLLTPTRHPPRLMESRERLQFKEEPQSSDNKPAVDGRKAIKKKHAQKFTLDAIQSPESQPAPMRTDGDIPMQNCPPDPAPAKQPPRPIEDGGRLQYRAAECEQSRSDEKPASVEDRPFRPAPAGHPPRRMEDRDRLQFKEMEGGRQSSDRQPTVNGRNRSKKRTQNFSPDAAQSPESQPAPMRTDGDMPMQDRPPGPAPEKRPPRPIEGGGHLQYKAAESERPPSEEKPAEDISVEDQPPHSTPAEHPPHTVESHECLPFEAKLTPPAAEVEKPLHRKHERRFAPDTARPAAVEPAVADVPGTTVPEPESPVRLTEDTGQMQLEPEPAPIAAESAPAEPNITPPKISPAPPPAANRKRLQFEDTLPKTAAGVEKPYDDPVPPRQQRKYDKAVERVEKAEAQVEQAQKNFPTKRRLSFQTEPDNKTGRPRRRLHFEQEVLPEYRKPSLPARAVGTVKTAAVMKLHGKIHESERENVAVEAVHKGELVAEHGTGRMLRWAKNRRRSKPYRALRQAERLAAKEKLGLVWQTALRDNPELRHKSALAKWMQKRKIKRNYAQAARSAGWAAQAGKNLVQTGGKIVRAAAQFVSARKTSLLLLAAMLLLTVTLFSAGLTSCSGMLSSVQAAFVSTSYTADAEDICEASLYFSELETDLQMNIDKTVENYPGYDEYRYSIGEISHNPYELMAYLTAAYGAFTFDEAEAEISRIFAEKYELTRTVTTETRYDGDGNPYSWRVLQTTLTVRPMSGIIAAKLADPEDRERYNIYMQTKGNRQGFGNPFDFPWLGSVSSGYGYRVHPITGEKNLHRGVDIAAAEGTAIRAVQDGRVVSAGNAGGYGLCVVIEDETGCQSRYAHCSSLSVSAGQEVKRGDVVAAVGSTGSSTGPHLHLEVMMNSEYLNPYFFVDTGDAGTSGTLPGGPVIPGYSGAPMDGGSFDAMLAEAEKYIGYPYVWGGSSPSTSFDCSGYVSWVINQSGVGSVGRQGVLGLESLCTPVSAADAQPGDLIFFIGTYDAPLPGPTHVGIYTGDGRFIHCGSSGVAYGSVDSSYWQAHFYGYGRIN